MPLLLVEIKQTELGYCVNCYDKGSLEAQVMFKDKDLAEFYAENFIEEVGVPFPALFDTVH
jgi:hypothetical protein